ncbi:MAG: hypothetical protein LBI44_01805 [Oscillospiraceae bacterium]|jgi:hypothetical protein|nr:hypothetical protein [Oscillospiraceae bacterium]
MTTTAMRTTPMPTRKQRHWQGAVVAVTGGKFRLGAYFTQGLLFSRIGFQSVLSFVCSNLFPIAA